MTTTTKIRSLLAAVLLALVAVPAVSAAAADGVVTQQPVTSGFGPDDLISYRADGFPTADPVAVSLDAVGGTYHADLPTLTPFGSTNLVVAASTQRTPADLTPGQYTITFTQPASTDGGTPVTVTTPSFPIVTPAIEPLFNYPHPGETLPLRLVGLGAGPSVHRTVTLDEAPIEGRPSESLSAGVYESISLPTSITPGLHTAVVTQDVNPTATVSLRFTVYTPTVTLTATSTSERGTFTVSGQNWGFGDQIVLSVRDGGDDVYPLGTVGTSGTSFSTSVTLPGIGGGTATVIAQSAHNKAKASATVDVYGSELRSGEYLTSGGRLQSPRGGSTFVMQGDGNLVLYTAGKATWSSRTSGHPGAYLAVQSDGNLVVYAAGRALWSSNTARQDPPVKLYVQDDGNVVAYSNYGRVIWSTGTGAATGTLTSGQTLSPGSRLSGGGRIAFVMQTDGNAVLYGRNGTATFASHTNGHPGSQLVLQPDGNLVVYSPAGAALWANNVFPGGGTRLVVQGDGNLVEYTPSGKPVWATNTAGR